MAKVYGRYESGDVVPVFYLTVVMSTEVRRERLAVSSVIVDGAGETAVAASVLNTLCLRSIVYIGEFRNIYTVVKCKNKNPGIIQD